MPDTLPKTSRRFFLQSCAAMGAVAAGSHLAASPLRALDLPSSAATIFRVQPDPKRALISFLSWDTEDGARLGTNLLRSPGLGLRMRAANLWIEATELLVTVQALPHGIRYLLRLPGDSPLQPKDPVLRWDISYTGDSLTATVSAIGAFASRLGDVQIVFPFDAGVTPTTVLPASWQEHGNFDTPAIISAPDFGQVLLEAAPGTAIAGTLEGSRYPRAVDLILSMPALSESQSCTFHLTPVRLHRPQALSSSSMWPLARRGWFNVLQPSATWGIPDPHHHSGVPGVLANNVISDACSFAEFFYADLILWTPELARGISAARSLRDTVEFWLRERTSLDDEVIGYTDYVNFLDANPSMLICAWDYVEATGDLPWLKKWMSRLEGVAEYNARGDQDQDGLIEATQSGNANTLWMPGRSSNWYDAVNFGHKDAYSNAVIYRGWRCLADLEARLHRQEKYAHYTHLADRLKKAYARELHNPQTGWIACWKSADGKLHDYASPIINGMAIEYGLVEPAQGRQILDRLWSKMQTVGFTRFDLGVPSFLEPVHRSDYLKPHSVGLPTREDGTDTFQQFENGGVDSGHTLHFLAANYAMGYRQKGDRVLQAMLSRQQKGGFQNGIQNGGESTTWNGHPSGYEGYLADNYYFLLAVLLREPDCRKRFYKPLFAAELPSDSQ